MAVQSALYLLERAGHLQRVANAGSPPWDANRVKLGVGGVGGAQAGSAGGVFVPPAINAQDTTTRNAPRRTRGIVMLENVPAAKLRLMPGDVERRAALERRKLREIIEFCYSEYCYRAHILDYFGDRHHARQCGTCGNCAPHSAARRPLAAADTVSEVRPPGRNRKNQTPIREPAAPRALTSDENLRVRKILACASRLKGRFGKNILAATLRGSAAKNVMQAHLNELSTYGLLKDMKQDDILLYIEALCAGSCLRVSSGEYPTISITDLGNRVMREQERIELAL
jgi:superfamily II DNA helicase RecQ